MALTLTSFSSRGFESWDVERRPLIPEGMPVLIDGDLVFEDGAATPRPATVVNGWLRGLPSSGAPAPNSWANYARVLRGWREFLDAHGVELFDSRERLKQALGRYAEHRAAGPVDQRFAASTWGQHMSVLSLFYRWAMAEGHARCRRLRPQPRGAPAGCQWPCCSPRWWPTKVPTPRAVSGLICA
ncbi:MAG: site-specific integrase, partial [Acidimicrobiales bacterium]